MIKNLLGLALVLLLNNPFLLAQHHEKCGFDHKHNQLLLNKAYRDFINKTESEIQKSNLVNQNHLQKSTPYLSLFMFYTLVKLLELEPTFQMLKLTVPLRI